MEKKVFRLLGLVISVIFAIHAASAYILLSQPSSSYNLGNAFSSNITLNPSSDTNGFLTADIICDNGNVNVYKNFFNVQAYKQSSISLSVSLDSSLTGNLNGNCYLDAKFGSDESKSQVFHLLSQINVALNVSSVAVSPGQAVTVFGSAIRADGSNANGLADISLQGTSLNATAIVSNGQFSSTISIPENAASGYHYLSASVYETSYNGQVSNQGYSSIPVDINPVVENAYFSLAAPSISPDSELSYTPALVDQTGAIVNELSVPVSIYDSKGNLYEQDMAVSGESNTLQIPYDALPGQWTIRLSYNGTTAKSIFNVSELRLAGFSLENQTLVIKNKGNIPYNGDVNVSIGQTNYKLNVHLDVDEAKYFKLSAPNGNYEISVSDNQNSAELGNSYLTGNAISVKEVGTSSLASQAGLWVLFVVIILLLAVAVYYYRRYRSRTYFLPSNLTGSRPKFIPIDEKSFPSKEIDKEARKVRLERYSPESSALPAELNGNKEDVTVIVLKIKNAARLRDSQSSAFLTIEHLLQKARTEKAKVYDQGLFKIIIFSPRLTQKTDLENYTEAVKMASHIDSALKEFNKKYAIKIDYGIGGHVGQMFLEFIEGKVKFTSAGNATVVAKNAAEKANNEVLISSLLHRKVYNILKTEQTPYGLYRVNSIIDRSGHSQFIQKFMKKSKE